MKLFIDTSSNFLIYGLIENKKVISFLKKETNKNGTKIAISILNKFLANANVKFEDIDGYYLSIGPGSFTGIKIGLNIIKTIDLIYPVQNIYQINSFNLLHDKDFRFVVLPFGKNKYYLKDYQIFLGKFRKNILYNDDEKILEKAIIGYKDFDDKILEEKIQKNKFKKIKLKELKLIYIDNFKGKIVYGN